MHVLYLECPLSEVLLLKLHIPMSQFMWVCNGYTPFNSSHAMLTPPPNPKYLPVTEMVAISMLVLVLVRYGEVMMLVHL